MRTMKLTDIKISSVYATTTPREHKLVECRNNWEQHHRQDRYIVVNHNGFLIDGYIMYLILKENGIDEAEVKISNKPKKRWRRKNTYDWNAPHYRNEKTTYVYGKHMWSACKKNYVWRVPKSWTWFAENLQEGDHIWCMTKHGVKPIEVTKVEMLDKCPIDLRVKKVANQEIIRNGVMIEAE